MKSTRTKKSEIKEATKKAKTELLEDEGYSKAKGKTRKELSSATSSLFPAQGVNISVLQEILEHDRYSSGMTTYEVCRHVIKPMTKHYKCSYVELVTQVVPNSAALVETATVFVSHAWDYKFSVLLKTLESFVKEETLKDSHAGEKIFFWIDIVCINQHLPAGRPSIWYKNTFIDGMKTIGHTICVFSQWEGHTYLERLWCVWELYCSIRTKSKIDILMPKKERESFLSHLCCNFDDVLNKLCQVDIVNAKYRRLVDQTSILNTIYDGDGVKEVNRDVSLYFYTWVGLEVVKNKDQSHSNDDDEPFAILMSRVASLLFDQGRYEESEGFLVRALGIYEGLNEPKSPDLATAINNLAVIVHWRGDYEKASALYKRVLEIREIVFGSKHFLFSESLNNLALLYEEQGKYREAQALFQKALQIRQNVYGANHLSVAEIEHNIGALYWKQKNFQEAEIRFKEALEVRESAMNSNPVIVAASLDCLASFYNDTERYDESQEYFEKALKLREQNFGVHSLAVALTLNNFGMLKQNQGNNEEAQALVERALKIYQNTLGNEHEETLFVQRSLEALRNS